MVWLAGCQTLPAEANHAVDEPAASIAPEPAAPSPQAPSPVADMAATAEAQAAPAADLLAWSLDYAEQLRQMQPAEVTAEIARLGEPGSDVKRQMQLALALMHAPLPNDTTRTLGLLQRLISHPSDEADPLRPLARLLATRLATQRKLEEGNERLNQQWREAQRRIELLNERIDAMRAIERSLSPLPNGSHSR